MNQQSVFLLLVMAALLFMLLSRGRRQQRAVQTVQAQLAPGAKIVTTAGLFATVVEVEGAVVLLETAPGQQSRWDKRAVARILPAEAVQEPAMEDSAAAAETIEDGAPENQTIEDKAIEDKATTDRD